MVRKPGLTLVPLYRRPITIQENNSRQAHPGRTRARTTASAVAPAAAAAILLTLRCNRSSGGQRVGNGGCAAAAQRQDCGAARVREDERQPRRRVARIDGHVRRAGLCASERASD